MAHSSEQDYRHDTGFRVPFVPWSPQFGYDGFDYLSESAMDCFMEGCQTPEPAISSTSAFEDLAHFICDDAISNEIVSAPLHDQMLKTKRSNKARVLSNVKKSGTSKRGPKRTRSRVEEGCNDNGNTYFLNSCSCISEDQEEPSTNPQSLYAKKRRERINERLRILQNLVPNGTKVDISTMLEEAVHYVKFLQLQIKLLSSDELWMYAPIAFNGVNIGLDLKISPLQKQ
ncbi:transcription factor bHLH84-like [Zingiber officinale]|uniref:BHLH domain-containing protein n=1 Tax=Zingiber officinale TaxID=94328 RepID=A0A8J5LMR1_ZINOF|nr:transcription factor bHLH84-like [Zingiber officinale]XP_042464132.1 transcription factor bHLH84-like [Zingiber officinale]KAG6525827.1 hypothetical protein ZIOFF_015798 [Zingiber officinale]KAG6529677.1 hypothetical protein ZIOFF_011890 [Zingiber officinale]